MSKRVKIELTQAQREEFGEFMKGGEHNVHLVQRAQIVLALDASEGRSASKQEDIARIVGVSRQTVNDAKRDFLAAPDTGSFLRRKPLEKPPNEPKITGDVEARVVALASSEPPEGRARWTLRLLAEKTIELQIGEGLSHMSVSRTLKKHNLSLT
jgi:transposase